MSKALSLESLKILELQLPWSFLIPGQANINSSPHSFQGCPHLEEALRQGRAELWLGPAELWLQTGSSDLKALEGLP